MIISESEFRAATLNQCDTLRTFADVEKTVFRTYPDPDTYVGNIFFRIRENPDAVYCLQTWGEEESFSRYIYVFETGEGYIFNQEDEWLYERPAAGTLRDTDAIAGRWIDFHLRRTEKEKTYADSAEPEGKWNHDRV